MEFSQEDLVIIRKALCALSNSCVEAGRSSFFSASISCTIK